LVSEPSVTIHRWIYRVWLQWLHSCCLSHHGFYLLSFINVVRLIAFES
jgi:hypothetical protein